MAAETCDNCSLTYFYNQASHPLETSSLLLLILLGKTLLSLFVLRIKRQDARESFMEHFCISLALLDFILLVTLSFIFYFEDFALWGVRFTKYHICLVAQIMSLTYGILHCPVYLVAGLDHYLMVTQTSKVPNICQRLFYIFAVVLIWVSVTIYVLRVPGIYAGLETQSNFFAYQCPLYISIQSYWLSVAMLLVICIVLVVCWSEVIDMVRSVRLISYTSETVLFFPYTSDCNYSGWKKQLLTRLLICFLGTWAPFVLLQMIILLLGAQIPTYMEMNVPWLYFMN
uniref:G protein-coupled receptor 160 n=1 Tax=Sphenodon punctatus TaxID=8508 RepID=A0A8D0HFC9_SPHPU